MAISCHLGYYRTRNSAIRSTDPENPCLERNMEWIRPLADTVHSKYMYGSDALFARYLPLNYTVTLKMGFGVTQGHQKRHYSIEHIRLYIRLL